MLKSRKSTQSAQFHHNAGKPLPGWIVWHLTYVVCNRYVAVLDGIWQCGWYSRSLRCGSTTVILS